MSFEGYYQILCGNGHLVEDDVYYYQQEGDYWKCKVCGEREAWRNLVDTTNGIYFEDERIDGHVELEIDHQPVSRECDMGHIHSVSPTIYKIPQHPGSVSFPEHICTTAYVKVKLKVQHLQSIDPEDAVQQAVSECDYNFLFDNSNVKIVDTEITDTELEEE